MFSAWIVDSAGLVVPTASHVVEFAVSGAADFLGGGSGDPTDHIVNSAAARPAWAGAVMGVVRGRAGDVGTITVHVSAPGLRTATVQLASV